MKFSDLFPMCWSLVLRNRRRYNAVIAGIAFGTAGFILIQTLGDSVEKRMNENLELLGEATVMRADWDNHENDHPGEYRINDIVSLRRLPHVVAVAPVVTIPRIEAFFRSTQWGAGLIGVDQSYWKTQTPQVKSGRLISASDVVGRRLVCVLGQDVVTFLFDEADPVGRIITVGNLKFEVIGVLGGIQHTRVRAGVMIPITTAQSLFPGMYAISEIFIRADDWKRVEWVRQQCIAALSNTHKGYEKGIRVVYFPERVKKVQTTVDIVKIFVYASLLVTFILGKVGLTNVMLAAVQDRTREIGLRKALGAREELIMLQFLTESCLISLLAGSLGVISGVASVQFLKSALNLETSLYVMLMSVLLDLAVTLAIGVASGMYPSIRASRLDPVTAMRFE